MYIPQILAIADILGGVTGTASLIGAHEVR